MARFQWLIMMLRNLESKSYNKELEKPIINFEDLFRDRNYASKIKEIFKINGYTIDGKWHGLTNKKGVLRILCK
jgi:hypothetical protein